MESNCFISPRVELNHDHLLRREVSYPLNDEEGYEDSIAILLGDAKLKQLAH